MHFLVQWTFSFTASSLFPGYFGGEVVKDMSWTSYLCEPFQTSVHAELA